MTDALEDHVGTVSIGGRTIKILRFADDTDGLAGDEQELADLVSRLDNTPASYGMEISAEKTKLMTNNTNGINKNIPVIRQILETVSISRIAQTTAAMTRLKPIWKDKNITLRSKIRLMRSLVVHVNISIRMQDVDSYSRTTKKSTSHGNEVLTKDPLHLIQGPCNQQRGPQQNQTSHRAL